MIEVFQNIVLPTQRRVFFAITPPSFLWAAPMWLDCCTSVVGEDFQPLIRNPDACWKAPDCDESTEQISLWRMS